MNCISGEDMTLQANHSLTEMASESYTLSANDSNIRITNAHSVQASSVSETAEKVSIDSTIDDMDLSSPKKVNIKSSDKINLF